MAMIATCPRDMACCHRVASQLIATFSKKRWIGGAATLPAMGYSDSLVTREIVWPLTAASMYAAAACSPKARLAAFT